MIWQNIKNAFLSIRSAKLRSALTAVGVMIGVFAVLVMVGVGDGVKAEIESQISNLGTNVLTITSGKLNQSASSSDPKEQKGSGINIASGIGTSTLTEDDVKTIENTPNVSRSAAFGIISSSVAKDQIVSNSAFVIATTPSYFDIRQLKTSQGSFFSADDNSGSKFVAVIGADTKQSLFGGEDPIGKSISLRGKQFRVLGVIEKSDAGVSLGANADDIVIIPINSAIKLTGKNDVFRVIAEVDSEKNIEKVKASLEQSIGSNHSGADDFSVLTQKELLTTFSSILDILTTFVVAIAAISLLVGGIGIMNIMLVTVSERTKEIGIRKAMGATFGNIMGQFLTESIIISLIGGVIGVLASYLAGMVIAKLANITPVYSPIALISALGASLFIGVVFGTAPAIKAARKHPIQALKSL
ncbi:FtsX-like permease family protein [Patescibacteria group bacterium]|nr:FtsX-like permease family protein [Patescibacteria group bacterium]